MKLNNNSDFILILTEKSIRIYKENQSENVLVYLDDNTAENIQKISKKYTFKKII